MWSLFLKLGIFYAALLALHSNALHAAPQIRKIALVIGNSQYQELPILKNATRDTNAVARALSAKGFTVFLIQDGTAQDMEKSIHLVSNRARNADQILVYYAGHSAIQDRDIKLIPIAGEDNKPSAQSAGFSIAQLLASFDVPFAQKTFIIDACLEVDNTPGNTFTKTLSLPSTLGHETLLVFATSLGQAAYDGTGSHSLFAGAFLDQLISPRKDLQSILRSVRKNVINTSRSHQIPISISTLTRPFVLGVTEQNTAQSGVRNKITQSYSNSGYADKPLLNALSLGLNGRGQ